LYGSDTADPWDTQVVTIEVAVSWQNPIHPCDVNANDAVTAEDLLILITYLNAHAGDASLPAAPATPPPFLDVNDDGWCTAADLLQVINYINAHSGVGGEGEASSQFATFARSPISDPSATSPVASQWNERSVSGTMTVTVPSTHYSAWRRTDGLEMAAEFPNEEQPLEFQAEWDGTRSAMDDFDDELERLLACIAHDIDLEWKKLR
jgi:hypothetical protein